MWAPVARIRLGLTQGAILAATRCTSALPLPVAYRIGRLGGHLAWLLWPRGRRCSQLNLARVTGQDPKIARRYARASFAYYGTYLIDFLRFGGITPAELASSIEFDDWGDLETRRAGNGILFVTMHFGNWDLAGAVVAQRMPMTVIADTFDNPALHELVVGSRERLGMHVVSAERPGPELLRALRRNDVLAALADVPPLSGRVRVEFFGAPIDLPDGLARIALRAGAPIVVGGVWRQGPIASTYQGAAEPVSFEASGDREQDVVDLSQAMVRALERLVRRAPEQWYAFRDLWRTDELAPLGPLAPAPGMQPVEPAAQ